MGQGGRVPAPEDAAKYEWQMTDIHSDKILILDFGAQYTQLIARRVREFGVYCEIWAWDHDPAEIARFAPKGIILSGGPESTIEAGSRRSSWAAPWKAATIANSAMRRSKSSPAAPCSTGSGIMRVRRPRSMSG